MIRLGIIGYGLRIRVMMKQFKLVDESVVIAAITDVRNDEIKKELMEAGIDISEIGFYAQAEEMLASEKLDGVCIGTRCSLHTKMALKVLPLGIPLFLEKPVATSMEGLLSLRNMYNKCSNSWDKVVVSFPLRFATIIQKVKELVDSGKLGTIEHVQAINNVPYGGVYYHNWYRDENEAGGLFLQKATHDFDYINYIIGFKPIRICAVKSKQIFKGDKPVGLKCSNCYERETCPESPKNYSLSTGENANWEDCCFAVDTGNEDSGSAIIQYDTGMHVTYSQNFFARKKAAARGARFLGYDGTLEFDLYTSEINVYMHHSPVVENYKIDVKQGGHFGGDFALAKNFINIIKDKEKSNFSMEDGLVSALMCLKAKKSSDTYTFQDIGWGDEDVTK